MQYEGFINTPNLWRSDEIAGLHQFIIPKFKTQSFTNHIPEALMLGKRVERFFSYQIKQSEEFEIIIENLQITKNKITLGELDCILRHRNELIHLEIVYKFYLYDPSSGVTELAHWIGPNRKDSLIEKVEKLTQKQLPLLYKPETQEQLARYKLSDETITQKVLYKAQLYIPLNTIVTSFPYIDNECIIGFYCNLEELKIFSSATFYIPIKQNWLINPHNHVEWLTYGAFINQVTSKLNTLKSPLCWMKNQNGDFTKFFVVWW